MTNISPSVGNQIEARLSADDFDAVSCEYSCCSDKYVFSSLKYPKMLRNMNCFLCFFLFFFAISLLCLDVRECLQEVKSGDEVKHLRALRSKLNALNNASSDSIRKNVFQNYQQFIETSKEISRNCYFNWCFTQYVRNSQSI